MILCYEDALDAVQTGLEAVAVKTVVGERRTDAVFREAVRLDAQLVEE